MNLPDSTEGRRGFRQRTLKQMPGQFQLVGIFRRMPVADQPWAPAVGGDIRGTLETPPNLLDALVAQLTVARATQRTENAAYENVQFISLGRVLFADFSE